MDLTTLTHIFMLVIVQSILKSSDGRSINAIFRSDYTYLDNIEGFYKIHTNQKTWPEAKRVCELEGATLFYPEHEKEAREVIDLWIRTQPQFYWIYIGIDDILAEGVFKTVKGRPIAEVHHNWDDDEPNNVDGNEDCVIMLKNSRLNDVRCNNVYPFVCKKAFSDILTAKVVDLEKELANQRAVLEAQEREAQAIKLNQNLKVVDLEKKLANRTAVLEAVEREAQAVNLQLAANQTILTAKVADLEEKLANRTAVLEAVEREAQAVNLQLAANQTILAEKVACLDEDLTNRTAVLEVLEREAQDMKIQAANQSATIKDLEREVNQQKQPTCCNGLDRIAEAVANHTAASERISKAAGEKQAAELERISKTVETALETISKSVEKQATAMEKSSKSDENQTAALQLLIETMQRQAVNQTVAMERQALALEAWTNNEQQ